MRTKLMKMEYFDLKAETRLETYANMVVIEKEGNASFITAVRFRGYPDNDIVDTAEIISLLKPLYNFKADNP